MPNWQPVSVPDFCPTCGGYWECECEDTGEMSEFEEAVEAASAAGKQLLLERIDQRFDELKASIRDSENQGWNERNPGTHIIWDKPGLDDA